MVLESSPVGSRLTRGAPPLRFDFWSSAAGAASPSGATAGAGFSTRSGDFAFFSAAGFFAAGSYIKTTVSGRKDAYFGDRSNTLLDERIRDKGETAGYLWRSLCRLFAGNFNVYGPAHQFLLVKGSGLLSLLERFKGDKSESEGAAKARDDLNTGTIDIKKG